MAASKIEPEHVKALFERFGTRVPFYEDDTNMPKSTLKKLVRQGVLQPGGNKNKGYLWTETGRTFLESLAADVETGGRNLRSFREHLDSGSERPRGFAFGTRRIPRARDSDGNPTR